MIGYHKHSQLHPIQYNAAPKFSTLKYIMYHLLCQPYLFVLNVNTKSYLQHILSALQLASAAQCEARAELQRVTNVLGTLCKKYDYPNHLSTNTH